MNKKFLLINCLWLGMISGLLFDILREVREVSIAETIIFNVMVFTLTISYYFFGANNEK